jgi:ABC-type branched-subunit amino acid transport system substrate-binding protein
MRTQLGAQVVRISMSVNSVQDIIKELGEEQARGIVFSQAIPYPLDSNRRIVREYLAAMKKYAPTEQPSYQSLEGFMNAKVAAEAIRRTRPPLTSAAIAKTLASLGKVDLGDLVVNFQGDRKLLETGSDVVILGPKGRLVR